MKGDLQNILKLTFHQMLYTQWGQGRNTLLLECGCESVRKTSVPIPQRARCQGDCERSSRVPAHGTGNGVTQT